LEELKNKLKYYQTKNLIEKYEQEQPIFVNIVFINMNIKYILYIYILILFLSILYLKANEK